MTLPRSPEQLRGRRAARWLRESTAGQMAMYGPDSQRRLQDRAIAHLELVDSGLAWEPAQSGSTVYLGPAMAAMLDAARAGEFDVLVVAYVDRWQRNLRQTLNLLEDELHPAGVAVWFCDEEILSSNDRAWDQLVDRAKAAESWLRVHRKRVREGLAAKLASKRDPGGRPPFGFRRNAEKLVEPDPAKGPVVRTIFEHSAGGLADREVAALSGVPLYTVRGILTSPLYVGRLRDGGPANWPPLVDVSVWNRIQAARSRRATNAGRPAHPSRPYALSMLYCASCGGHLTGDTGYYMHRDACLAFMAARPARAGRGRRDGKCYRREWYEGAIGQLLERVRLNASTLAAVVGEVAAPPASVDRLALARIERERDVALARYRRDRDAAVLERTMARLDREQVAAEQPVESEGIDAGDARRYLEQLADTWQALEHEPGRGRRMLAEALFERIEALGFREATVHLTETAARHGLAAVLPSRLELAISGYGRGERI
ncbi:MAG TPA: recombinase family protein [Candidatus Limnocylindrales bacterium]|nr:recombinase family protein [Candidatus Limnocylindrales bacterium]